MTGKPGGFQPTCYNERAGYAHHELLFVRGQVRETLEGKEEFHALGSMHTGEPLHGGEGCLPGVLHERLVC